MSFYLFGLCTLQFILAALADIEPHPDKGVLMTSMKGYAGTTTEGTPVIANLGFIHAFIASISVILVSEIGDKTFFIAAIMAMRHPRITVFIGAISALALMTILSVVFGLAATVIPRVYTYYISTVLFIIFGLKMLREGCKMSPTEAQDELEEVQSDLRRREDELAEEKNRKKNKWVSGSAAGVGSEDPTNIPQQDSRACNMSLNSDKSIINSEPNGNSTVSTNLPQFEREVLTDVETGSRSNPSKIPAPTIRLLSKIIVQAFTLTFLAEWGDRSQLTTIVLAATEDPYGVTIGGILGHAICTSIAVIGGRFIAQRISVRTVTIIGGIVFLIFAVTSLVMDPYGKE